MRDRVQALRTIPMLLFYSTGFTMGLFMKMGNSEVGTAKGDEFGLGLVDFELILFIHV